MRLLPLLATALLAPAASAAAQGTPPGSAPPVSSGGHHGGSSGGSQGSGGNLPPVPRVKHGPRTPLAIALQDDDVFLKRTAFTTEGGWAATRPLGVSWLRVNVTWADAVGTAAKRRRAPATIPYDWSHYDAVVDDAAAHGVHVQFTLTGPAPAFATRNHKIGPKAPKPAEFARFARDAASHFKGRVTRYALWNEPNYISWLAPHRQAPNLYRGLVLAAYPAIKTVDSAAQVLIGETAPIGSKGRAEAPLAFLRQLTCSNRDYTAARKCTPIVADGWAHHPYTAEAPPSSPGQSTDDVTTGSLDRLAGALDRLAARGAVRTAKKRSLDLYLTEFGIFARGARAAPVSERPRYLKQGFLLAEHNPRVREMLQYGLVSPPPQFPFDTAVLDAAGKPLPTFAALSNFALRAIKAKKAQAPSGPITLPPAPTGAAAPAPAAKRG